MRHLIVIIWVFLFPFISEGQAISNVRASFEAGKITVTYDLTGGNDKQAYNVALYSSHDNYKKPVISVSGDVGNNKNAGVAKRIVWDAQVDLGEYKGALTFRVSADPIPLAYSFIEPTASTKYRRGKSASIAWEGGAPADNITIDLLNNGNVVQQISSARNSGIQNWIIPKDMTKGDGYQVRLQSSSGQNITSNIFSIKSKIPLALKVLPVLVVGGVIALLINDPPPPAEELPKAPSAPTN